MFALRALVHRAARRRPCCPPPGATRCLAAGSPERVRVSEAAAPGQGYRLESGRHVLAGDLMPAAGGHDAGPSPKELLMLSLGMCTAMTVRLFADASKFPLASVSVAVAERTPPGGHLPDGLDVVVTLAGAGLTRAQRERLLRAAARCPVKRALAGEMRDGVRATLADAEGDAG